MLRLRQYFLQTNAYRTISNTFGYVASPFEEDDLRNDQSVNSKEKKWKKQIQQDISNFQPDGIEYPTSSILQQLAIDQCQEEYLKAQRQKLTSQLSNGTSVIKQLKTRSKLSDGLPTFFGANTNKSESEIGNDNVLKPDDVPNQNDFKSCRDHEQNDSGYSTPNQIEAAQKPEVNNDCEAAESTNGKPKNWKDFLEQLESKKESSFNEYQKDYESKIEFELKNRISIFKNEIEPALNVEVNKSRTAECIEKSRYLSPDVAYWNAKLNQYGNQSDPEIAFKSLEEAARMGHSDAKTEMEEIRSMYADGDYSSLVQSFSIAGPEILDERCYLDTYSTRAKEHRHISEPLFTKTDFARISSDPKF